MSDNLSELRCANCGRALDTTDKFCRECGLPTLRHATERQQLASPPPDTGEMRRALNAMPAAPALAEATPPPQTTGDVVRATSPTHALRLASSTTVMIVLIAVLALTGVALLLLALRP